MDYTKEAVSLLKRYEDLLDAVKLLRNEKRDVEELLSLSKRARVLDLRGKKDRLNDVNVRIRTVKLDLKRIENGFSALDEYERDLLTVFYVKKAVREKAEELAAKWEKSRSSVYRHLDEALRKFTLAAFGVLYTA